MKAKIQGGRKDSYSTATHPLDCVKSIRPKLLS